MCADEAALQNRKTHVEAFNEGWALEACGQGCSLCIMGTLAALGWRVAEERQLQSGKGEGGKGGWGVGGGRRGGVDRRGGARGIMCCCGFKLTKVKISKGRQASRRTTLLDRLHSCRRPCPAASVSRKSNRNKQEHPLKRDNRRESCLLVLTLSLLAWHLALPEWRCLNIHRDLQTFLNTTDIYELSMSGVNNGKAAVVRPLWLGSGCQGRWNAEVRGMDGWGSRGSKHETRRSGRRMRRKKRRRRRVGGCLMGSRE